VLFRSEITEPDWLLGLALAMVPGQTASVRD
jgi:hypothetical protein